MKSTPIADLEGRVQQTRVNLARLRRDQYANREEYQRAVERRDRGAEKWKQRLLDATAANTLTSDGE